MLSADEGTRVGMISKQWSGLAKEIFTDADNFGVSFPQDMDVRTKATVLGAVFLIVSLLDGEWQSAFVTLFGLYYTSIILCCFLFLM